MKPCSISHRLAALPVAAALNLALFVQAQTPEHGQTQAPPQAAQKASESHKALLRAPVCDTRSTVAHLQKHPSFAQVFLAGPETCNSLRNILRRLAGSSVSGGKKLQGNPSWDPIAADRERIQTKADPTFASDLAALQAPESEALRQLLLEAALLDEHGKYAARDAVLLEIQALMKQ